MSNEKLTLMECLSWSSAITTFRNNYLNSSSNLYTLNLHTNCTKNRRFKRNTLAFRFQQDFTFVVELKEIIVKIAFNDMAYEMLKMS